MDIVICVALKDCFIVKKNIYYIRKNIYVQNIYIIIDSRNSYFFSKNYCKKNNIILIDEAQLIPNRQNLEEICKQHFTCQIRFGWYYQQFLKMGFALSKYAKEYYLIWDSDTIPLTPLTFIEQNKMVFTPKSEYHKPYFETIKKLIGYDKETNYSFIAEHMIINVSIMRELIQQIEQSPIKGNSWISKIINATPPHEPNGFSEFETYGTFCHHNYINHFVLKKLRTFRNGGEIYSRGISHYKLRKLAIKYDTISIESWNTPKKSIRRMRNNIEIYFFNTISTIRTLYPFIRI